MAINGISEVGKLKGIITIQPQTLVGQIKQVNTLSGSIEVPDLIMPFGTYEGEYEVTPAVDSQVMETKNRLMEEDVTILAIPYFETSNPTGKTVYIGGE